MLKIKTLRLKSVGKFDLIDFQEILFFLTPIISPLVLSSSCIYLSFGVALVALLSYTPSKPNPHCDYHIMLLPYYQNGADLAFVVVKD